MLGSSVTVAPVDKTGQPSGKVFRTSTNNDRGEFGLTVDYTGPAQLSASGFYYNEITGEVSGARITLRAFGKIARATQQKVYINTVTHLTHRRVEKLLRRGLQFK